MLSDVVAGRIILWRKRRGWNRERLAEECKRQGMAELTPAVIGSIETGRRLDGVRRRHITIDELAVLARVFEVPVESLFGAVCDLCGNSPPAGFTCNDCGATGVRAEAS